MDSSTTSTHAPRLSRRTRAAAAGTALCAAAALAACSSSTGAITPPAYEARGNDA